MRLTKSLLFLCVILLIFAGCIRREPTPGRHAVYPLTQGFVDANGVLLYYMVIGSGHPLMILHGGPGASHEYFLPYLLPLARNHMLVFVDERGSGRSEKLEDVKGYTIDAMADDIEAVRKALGFGKVALLGHSYGGALAQTYALKYQENLDHLILCSTWHSTRQLNQVFQEMMAKMSPGLRDRIRKMEAAGLYGKGRVYERGRYSSDYMIAAWGEGYFPYLYQRRPDPNYDPVASGVMSWDLYREMWGSNGEFLIDGNLTSVEYANRLPSLHVPTLITVGDTDECDPVLSREMQKLIKGSKLVVFPRSGHMTFVDQPGMFLHAVDEFLKGGA